MSGYRRDYNRYEENACNCISRELPRFVALNGWRVVRTYFRERLKFTGDERWRVRRDEDMVGIKSC